MNPTDSGTPLPEGSDPTEHPKPWQKPQPQEDENNANAADGGSGGDVIDAGVEGADALISVGDVASGAADVAGGCAEGCSGCSLAILILLSVAVSSAMAMFR